MSETIDQVLGLDSTALDRLIDETAGFRSRERRDRPVLVRFTEAEIALLDKLAADKSVTRIEVIRRLIDSGVGRKSTVHDLAVQAGNLVRMIRNRRQVSSFPPTMIAEIETTIAEITSTVQRPVGRRREARTP